MAKSGVNEKRLGVTKKEIVKSIAEKTGTTQLTTKAVVQETFNAIIDALVTGKRVELRNFGVFDLKVRAARRARNPRTGEQVDVPAKLVVTFKPGKEMEERVHQVEQLLWPLVERGGNASDGGDGVGPAAEEASGEESRAADSAADAS